MLEQNHLMGIFDSHAHYNDESFGADFQETVEKINREGVCGVINVGCDRQTNHSGIELSRKYPFFYCSVGYHPHDAGRVEPDYLQELETLSAQEKVVAIGEIGLDYHYDSPSREVQLKVFEEQLELAVRLDMPVIIHSREATKDTMELLNKYRPKGVVHCFSGSAQTAREVVALGMYLGFTGVLTFPNARKAREAVEAAPLDRLLLETDCPYMAPVPHRGKRCDSSMIVYTAEKMAELKQIPVQAMIDQARENTCRLFGMTL